MRPTLLEILRCPFCSGPLVLRNARESNDEIESGELACSGCGRAFPVVRFIPRFVPIETYEASFGFQWNEFRKTQLDSHTGLSLSRERLEFSTGWTLPALAGRRVLDVGCGAGRFAEVALGNGAELVALDYSSAVEACRANLGPNGRLDVVQGDIYHLPFRPGSFDDVYCLGVLQHTPDVEQSFMSLPLQLRAGGRLAVDVYPALPLNVLWPKYWLRPITKRLPQRTLFRLVKLMVRFLLPVSRLVSRIPWIGRKLRYLIPVMNHEPDFPLSRAQLREWAVLDTYDMLAPEHDHPQTAATLRSWFEKAGLQQTEVFRRGHLIGRAVKG